MLVGFDYKQVALVPLCSTQLVVTAFVASPVSLWRCFELREKVDLVMWNKNRLTLNKCSFGLKIESELKPGRLYGSPTYFS